MLVCREGALDPERKPLYKEEQMSFKQLARLMESDPEPADARSSPAAKRPGSTPTAQRCIFPAEMAGSASGAALPGISGRVNAPANTDRTQPIAGLGSPTHTNAAATAPCTGTSYEAAGQAPTGADANGTAAKDTHSLDPAGTVSISPLHNASGKDVQCSADNSIKPSHSFMVRFAPNNNTSGAAPCAQTDGPQSPGARSPTITAPDMTPTPTLLNRTCEHVPADAVAGSSGLAATVNANHACISAAGIPSGDKAGPSKETPRASSAVRKAQALSISPPHVAGAPPQQQANAQCTAAGGSSGGRSGKKRAAAEQDAITRVLGVRMRDFPDWYLAQGCFPQGTQQRDICPKIFRLFSAWFEQDGLSSIRDAVLGRSCLINKTVVPGSYPGLLLYLAAVSKV